MSDQPLVKGALKPGSHLDLVGSYLPHMRETDDDAMRRGSVYACCDRGREDVGELTMPMASALHMADIKLNLDLAQGRFRGEHLQTKSRFQKYRRCASRRIYNSDP